MNSQILTTLVCPYPLRGYLGRYGVSTDKVFNDKLIECQKLSDKHNELINSFSTEEENTSFHNQIVSQIDKIFKDAT